MRRALFTVLVGCVFVSVATAAVAEDPQPIASEKFDDLHAMFKTQPGESRYWDLPWMIQLDEALKKGAAEEKPVFVWCGAGGAPVGVC